MKVRFFALALSGAAVLFAVAAPAVNAQLLFGPDGAGKLNAYQRGPSLEFPNAHDNAKATTFPGLTIGGVEVLAPSNMAGHLITIPNSEVNAWVASNVGPGFLGLSDSEDIEDYADLGATEDGNNSGNAYPAEGEEPGPGDRGYGWVWADGSPLVYQNWNGGEPNDYNNGAPGEDAAEILSSGQWNDIGAGPDVFQNSAPRSGHIEWDIGLDALPFNTDIQLEVAPNGILMGKVAVSRASDGAPIASGYEWELTEVIPGDVAWTTENTGVGPMIEVYDFGFFANDATFSALAPFGGAYGPGDRRPVTAPWRGLPSWGHQGSDAPETYPSQLVNAGFPSNKENYGTRVTGEIYLEEGTYFFRDGVDDFAKLVIDGEVLINDESWTGWDSIDNSNGGVAPGSEIPFDAPADGWYAFEFDMGEGGGGDIIRLMWDRETGVDENGTEWDSPHGPQDVSGLTFYTVPTEVMRSTIPDSTISGGLETSLGRNFGSGVVFAPEGDGALGGDDLVPIPNAPNAGDNADHIYRLKTTVAGIETSVDLLVPAFTPGGVDPFVLLGDLNQDGEVGLADFNILKANFGASNGSAAVPEPSTVVLLGLGGLVGLVAYLRRRK